ncbi:MAG: capsule assembly Wzi family protein [Treponema sp.]|jgi:hypothetical protein|nr:capsule assembly Wzi family protein [Treponema sp.]
MNKVYRHPFILFLLILLKTGILYAKPFDMVLTNDPVFQDIRFLSLETGKPFLSYSPPLGLGELENFINSIDPENLSLPAKLAYDRIMDRLVPTAFISINYEDFTFLADLNFNLEARLKYNDNLTWPSPYPETPALISAPVRLGFFNSLQFYVEPVLIMRPGYNDRFDTFDINIPFSFSQTENKIPLRAFGAAGGNWWNFQIGRDKLYWGSGHTGSLSFNDKTDYYTFARASFFTPSVKYSVIVNQMPLTIYKSMIDTDLHNLDWDDDFLKKTLDRYFYIHRFDITLFKKLTISLMEGVMAGNSSIELQYLNPIMLFHSLFTWQKYDTWQPTNTDKSIGYMNGSFFSVELNYNIIRSLSVYGQFVMNQWATQEELKADPDQPPNGTGFLAGIQYSHSFNKWGSVFFLEFIYTDPYLHILNSPFASIIHMDYAGGYRFIGYPRDTITLSLGAEFFNQYSLNISGRFSWISKGEHDKDGLLWDWIVSEKATAEKTPSGSAENNFILSLDAKWKISKYITLNCDLTGVINNYKGSTKTGGQFTLGILLSL